MQEQQRYSERGVCSIQCNNPSKDLSATGIPIYPTTLLETDLDFIDDRQKVFFGSFEADGFNLYKRYILHNRTGQER